jgi:hypothetical protein
MKLLKANAWFGGMVSLNFISGKKKKSAIFLAKIFHFGGIFG